MYALLIPYLDGELCDADVQRVKQEFEKNPEYRREHEKLQRTDSLLRSSLRQRAPEHLIENIYAQLDRTTLADKLHKVIKGVQDALAPLFTVANPRFVAFAAALLIVFSGVLVYQYHLIQQQQLYIQELEAQHRVIYRSGETLPDMLAERFVILTGNLTPQKMSLEEAEFVASLSLEPESTEFPFLPGTIEALGTIAKAKMNAMGWEVREDMSFEEHGLSVRKLSAIIPDNSLLSFARFLQQLQKETPEDRPVVQTKTTRIEIYILDKNIFAQVPMNME